MIFWILWGLVVLQRLSEVIIAKRNEEWMREKGALEYGQAHYKWLVGMHIGYFLFIALEWTIGAQLLHPYWFVILLGYVLLQGLRIWMLTTLGKFWNTKILVIPGEKRITEGLYSSKLRHPNYLIVTLELVLFPLLFQAYVTAVLFTIFNALFLLLIRIPAEERALGEG
ncbi:isoprenylcysteine carboxyl methyltransferase family protein [Salipaludibacillus sp. CF4.18]|uniref:isoprenylcysteine carboxyl methyltransferase family protein n=1 Tax=Salipaludibacillus sp. CF4.18 TaxID=3373081 RepID=UPI003EE5A5DD